MKQNINILTDVKTLIDPKALIKYSNNMQHAQKKIEQ